MPQETLTHTKARSMSAIASNVDDLVQVSENPVGTECAVLTRRALIRQGTVST